MSLYALLAATATGTLFLFGGIQCTVTSKLKFLIPFRFIKFYPFTLKEI